MASRPASPVAPHLASRCRPPLDRAALTLGAGYGCFRGANYLMYSSAMATAGSPPVMFVATPLFVAVAALTALAIGALVAGVARSRLRSGRPPLRFRVLGPACLLALAQGMAQGLPPTFAALPTVVAGCGVLYAVGSTVLNIAWLTALLGLGATRGLQGFALAMVGAAAASLATGALGPHARFLASAGLLSLSVASLAAARAAGQPCTQPQPPCRPHTGRPAASGGSRAAAIGVPILISAVLEWAFSFLNGLFVSRGLFAETGALVPVGSLMGALGFAAIALGRPSALNPRRVYRAAFPALAAVIGLLPFVGTGEDTVLGGTLVALYSTLSHCAVAIVLARTAELGLNGTVAIGATTAVVRAFQLAGLAGGCALGSATSHASGGTYGLAAMAAVYGLALLLLALSRRGGSAQMPSSPTSKSPIDERAHRLGARHRLTAREVEVLALLAQGRSATVIAQELVCSPGTVRNHIKSIYAKLGVHSKQAVIDLFVQP